LPDGTELASKPFIAVGYVGCVAECYQLSAVSDGTPGAISAEDAYLLVHLIRCSCPCVHENGDVAGFSATFQGFLEAKEV